MKTLHQALEMFRDKGVRDRCTPTIEEAQYAALSKLMSGFARMAGTAVGRVLKHQDIPIETVLSIGGDKQFGRELGAAILGAFRLGVGVGIEMEKDSPPVSVAELQAEIERLKVVRDSAIRVAESARQAKDTLLSSLFERTTEVERLKSFIEHAPHEIECGSRYREHHTGITEKCDCWKSKVFPNGG